MSDRQLTWVLRFGWILFFLVLFGIDMVYARDTDGLSLRLTQQQRDWVKGLRNSNGLLCCDDADGIDPAWEMDRNDYYVHWQGNKLKVESWALLPGPNKMGVARAWIGWMDGKPYVRCFIPGATG